MSLAFLSPSPAAPARSPILDAALADGARTEVHAGWEVIASFGDAAAEEAACAESVGFADLSQLAKLEVQHAGGPAFNAGAARRLPGGWLCPVRPTLDLLLGEPAANGARTVPEVEGRACDLTGSLAAIAISGPHARDVLARFCALDLRPASLPLHGFRPGSVARSPGYVLREGEQRYLVLFGAAYGQYLWEVVSDAAGRFDGRPVGVDALSAIDEEPVRA
ncbi:MAG TPA: hypothetical protein VGH14_12380 [Solirubrobacterales bacterium]